MRKIKIRAWNTGNKEFENDYFIKCVNGHEKNVFIKFEMEKCKYKELKDKEILFLLNTGLKDKNGVEGFHKDVVKDFRGGYYTIEWDEHYANFILMPRSGDDRYVPIYFLQYGEIIGSSLMAGGFFR